MTVDTDRHCGYANYETWSVAATLDNDRALNEAMVKLVEGCAGKRLIDVADAIREFVERLRPIDDGAESTFTTPLDEGAALLRWSLLNAALVRVDWRELAETWIDEWNVEISTD